MPKGTVKWFNSQKGYDFIQPQGGRKDVFVHISAVERAGFSSLNEGQVIEYEEVSNRGKTSAENLRAQRRNLSDPIPVPVTRWLVGKRENQQTHRSDGGRLAGS